MRINCIAILATVSNPKMIISGGGKLLEANREELSDLSIICKITAAKAIPSNNCMSLFSSIVLAII
jgi:hypothetical protein